MNRNPLLSITLMAGLILTPSLGLSNEANPTNQSPMHKFAQYVDDTTTTTKVKAALMGDAGLNAFDIKVTTYNGIVQLSGFVDSENMRNMAVERVKSVSGVVSVTDSLLIKGESQ